MADPTHLKMLKRGPANWKRWRKESRVDPDLSVADLSGLHLEQVDFSGADLRGANLESAQVHGARFEGAKLESCKLPGSLTECHFTGIDLRGRDFWGHQLDWVSFDSADLRGADLRETELMGATLQHADLRDANLSGAGFICADLTETRLHGAKLDGCDLSMAFLVDTRLAGADLTEVEFDRTVLANVDLSRAAGLRGARHEAGSMIGIDTLERTLAGAASDAKRLQEAVAFFRSAGVPEHLIEHCRGRAGVAEPYHPALILHDRRDAGLGRTLHEELQSRGVRCWRFEIRDGDGSILERKWRGQERVIFCFSKEALASAWPSIEVGASLQAIETQAYDDVIAVDLDGCLREKTREPQPGWDPSEWVADLGRVVSGEGRLEEAVERVLEQLRR